MGVLNSFSTRAFLKVLFATGDVGRLLLRTSLTSRPFIGSPYGLTKDEMASDLKVL